MAGLRAARDFMIFILAGFGVLLLLVRLMEYGLVPDILVPAELQRFLSFYAIPQPFRELRKLVAENFAYNSAATHLYVAASETLLYQGFYLLLLRTARKCSKSFLSFTISGAGFAVSALVFAFLHFGITLALAGGIIFNLLVLRYSHLRFPLPLFPSFLLHLLWNLLPPPIPTLF